MYKIVNKKELNSTVTLMDIEAPLVARKARAGQFIILRVDDEGERIPLTISGADEDAGTVRIIFQIIGATTQKLNQKNEGDFIQDFVGPLGEPTKMEGYKKVCIIGGGVGCAIALFAAQEFARMGAHVTSIVGFRNKDIVILEEEFRAASDNCIVMTDDGSYGRHGNVTVPLKEMLESGETFDLILAIGPIIMMKFVVAAARPFGVPCTVSMNPIMIDGTGMCGGCRLTLNRDGKRITKFACVDGPDFNGYEVDFDEAMSRSRIYSDFEQTSRDETCYIMNAAENAKKPGIIPTRFKMPVQDPKVRARNFKEVTLGYPMQIAVAEANRCLNCKTTPCVKGCPVNINIPSFISKIKETDFEGAYKIISESSALPAVCGRVCPQESQCEKNCSLGVKFESVAIGRLERFAADWHNANVDEEIIPPAPNGHKVAVVGSGPSGLSCAGDLAKAGYDVSVFEALHEAGGVLLYGIPEFRLPKAIVSKEVENLKKYGVHINTNTIIGRTLTIDELFGQGYEAVFIGSGAGLPNFMNIPGESFKGVYSANEFLTRTNLMKAYKDTSDTPIMKGGRVAVVGGGNVAMDASRTALRLGADKVYIIYRRSMDELPARAEEVEHAIEEGVDFRTLSSPVEILGYNNPEDPRDSRNGFVTGIRCQKMELGEPDERGRRSPVPVEGSEYELDVDAVIMAIGTSPNPLIKKTTHGLSVTEKGCIIVNEEFRTSRDAVFAGGDSVTGAATVISAMGAGKSAAKAIDEFIKNK